MLLDPNQVYLETYEILYAQTYVELATAAERLVELRAYENINELFTHGPRVCINVHAGTAQPTCDDQRCMPERRISCTQWLNRQGLYVPEQLVRIDGQNYVFMAAVKNCNKMMAIVLDGENNIGIAMTADIQGCDNQGNLWPNWSPKPRP
jgi:hypothetical protein